MIIQTAPLHLPDIISNSNCIQINTNSSSAIGIGLSIEIIGSIADRILKDEIKDLMRKDPEFNIEKLQEMIISPDLEMFNLGLTIIREKTKYAAEILNGNKTWNKNALEKVIADHYNENKFKLI